MSTADWSEVLVDLGKTAAGFLLGLLGNGYANSLREKHTHRSMLDAIKSEAKSNETVLNDSFLKYYKDGLVLRPFSIATANRCVGDPLFIKYATPDQLEIVFAYVRNITLANAYRERCEGLRLGALAADAEERKAWLEGILAMWEKNLVQCDKSITAITGI